MAILSPNNVVSLVAALLGTLFAIIVMGVIANKAVDKSVEGKRVCRYELGENGNNLSTSVCDFGITMGVLGMLVGLAYSAFVALDIFKPIEVLSSKVALICRAAGAAFVALLWLVCFAVITDAYNSNKVKDATVSDSIKSGMEAGIAFSFLATLTWVVLFIFSLLNARSAETAAGTFNPEAPAVTAAVTAPPQS